MPLEATTPPAFASALSTRSHGEEALREVCDKTLGELGGSPDLALLFFSHHFAPLAESLARQACDALGTERLLGCSGESIVGVGREVEGRPSMSLWLARLPGVSLWPMHLGFERSAEGGAIVGWPDDLPLTWPSAAALIALGDPFSFPAELLLDRVNEDQPGTVVVGGMASGAQTPGQSRLLLGSKSFDEGAVAVLLAGAVNVRTVVSQGCRPIGRHFVVTKAERNIIHELGGRPALDQLKDIYAELPTSEQAMMQHGLHVGRVVSEYQDHFVQGDFLVRNVVGIDNDSGAMAVADVFRAGQTVQFHIRDHRSADQELHTLLERAGRQSAAPPAAALLFTCNGRGTRLFPQPHHDAQAVQKTLGEIPLAGFFAQGEMGPVGNRNFLHGFTASLALFEGK